MIRSHKTCNIVLEWKKNIPQNGGEEEDRGRGGGWPCSTREQVPVFFMF